MGQSESSAAPPGNFSVVAASGINALHADILFQVFRFLSHAQLLLRIAVVCKRWRGLALRSVRHVAHFTSTSKRAIPYALLPDLTSLDVTFTSAATTGLPTRLRALRMRDWHSERYLSVDTLTDLVSLTIRSPGSLDALPLPNVLNLKALTRLHLVGPRFSPFSFRAVQDWNLPSLSSFSIVVSQTGRIDAIQCTPFLDFVARHSAHLVELCIKISIPIPVVKTICDQVWPCLRSLEIKVTREDNVQDFLELLPRLSSLTSLGLDLLDTTPVKEILVLYLTASIPVLTSLTMHTSSDNHHLRELIPLCLRLAQFHIAAFRDAEPCLTTLLRTRLLSLTLDNADYDSHLLRECSNVTRLVITWQSPHEKHLPRSLPYLIDLRLRLPDVAGEQTPLMPLRTLLHRCPAVRRVTLSACLVDAKEVMRELRGTCVERIKFRGVPCDMRLSQWQYPWIRIKY